MIFTFDLLRACKGDCFLLHFGTPDEPGLVLIDGGPKSVYRPFLKPRLEQIKQSRHLTADDPLPVDMVMVSHIDDDHIHGLLDLTTEEKIALEARQPRLLNVRRLWHNSFDTLVDQESDDALASMKSQFGAAAVSGNGLSDEVRGEIEAGSSEPHDVVNSTLQVLASVEQGFRLRRDAEGLSYSRNPEFDGGLIIAQEKGGTVSIREDLTFTVVGPMVHEITALQKKHIAWLKELKEKGLSPPAALAAYVDRSVPNLSSIVVLVESSGKRMLLTGDARGDKIIEGLQLVGLLGHGTSSTMKVDILKVPHHGSANNLDTDFFDRIHAKHYVFSGNGEHGNPEREAFEMLVRSRGTEGYIIHLTYPIEVIDKARKLDWEKEQRKEKTRAIKKSETKVRPDWSPGRHSLESFFADSNGLADRVRIVKDGESHVIDLLDAVRI